MKVIFIPGNGGESLEDNWYPYLKLKLEKEGIEVIASEFPDRILARESYWIPFLRDNLCVDEQTILLGHSSGAIAAMRYAEKHRVLGSVLVSAYHTDMGLSSEKISGYFNRAWDWESIQHNQKWIIQFASTNDSLIPIEEARFVHEKLNTDYYEFSKEGHFGGIHQKLVFPELFNALKAKLLLI